MKYTAFALNIEKYVKTDIINSNQREYETQSKQAGKS